MILRLAGSVVQDCGDHLVPGTALASTLVHHVCMVGLGDFGIRHLVMVADPEDSAIRIYRALGFADSETQVGLSQPVHTPEVRVRDG